MSLRIQTNVEAFNAHRYLQQSSDNMAKSMEKLSSGYRINRAADDAAGLGISEKMRGQIGGLAQAQRNVQDGISQIQTAEGALSEVHSMLQRVRDLKVQYENGTNDTNDQQSIAAEVSQIGKEVSSILTDTKFNGTAVFSNAESFQVGAGEGETIAVASAALALSTNNAAAGGLSEMTVLGLSTTTVSTAFDTMSIDTIDTMIKNVSTQRGTYGAVQNRLEHRLTNLATYQENLTAAESRIRDVDMADEMTKFTKLNILQQAGTSMLAQANQAPQNVLSLLR